MPQASRGMEISPRIWDFRSSPSRCEGSQASPRVIYGSNVHSQCCVSASPPPASHSGLSPTPISASHLFLPMLPLTSHWFSPPCELPKAELGLLSTPFWAELSLAAERSEGGGNANEELPLLCPTPPVVPGELP